MFSLDFTPGAIAGMAKLKKSEPAAFKKLGKLLEELREHPATGTGHPEQLKGTSIPTWSRRITEKHRLVYAISDMQVKVLILSAYGHYNGK